MDIFTALHTRRSIRKYTNQPISEQMIHSLLDAAMIAPSAGNARPWQFIVVDDPGLLQQVPALNPYAAMAPTAPLGILVCGDLNAEKYKDFWIQDCSAAIENMLLAAVGLGLGSVWTGIYPVEERIKGFRRLFELPAHIVPLALVLIGCPAVESSHQSRFEEIKVHHNIWGKPKRF